MDDDDAPVPQHQQQQHPRQRQQQEILQHQQQDNDDDVTMASSRVVGNAAAALAAGIYPPIVARPLQRNMAATGVPVLVAVEIPVSVGFLKIHNRCLNVSPDEFHTWLMTQDVVTMEDLKKACGVREFVSNEMVLVGGLKGFLKYEFIEAVQQYQTRTPIPADIPVLVGLQHLRQQQQQEIERQQQHQEENDRAVGNSSLIELLQQLIEEAARVATDRDDPIHPRLLCIEAVLRCEQCPTRQRRKIDQLAAKFNISLVRSLGGFNAVIGHKEGLIPMQQQQQEKKKEGVVTISPLLGLLQQLIVEAARVATDRDDPIHPRLLFIESLLRFEHFLQRKKVNHLVEEFNMNLKEDVHDMITDQRHGEYYDGLDRERDTIEEVQSILQLFFDLIQKRKTTHWGTVVRYNIDDDEDEVHRAWVDNENDDQGDYPIQCLVYVLDNEGKQYLNIKAVPFIHLFAQLALEYNTFDDEQRGGLVIENGIADNIFEDLVQPDLTSCLSDDDCRRADEVRTNELIRLQQFDLLTEVDVRDYELLGHLCKHKKIPRRSLAFLIEWSPDILLLPIGYIAFGGAGAAAAAGTFPPIVARPLQRNMAAAAAGAGAPMLNPMMVRYPQPPIYTGPVLVARRISAKKDLEKARKKQQRSTATPYTPLHYAAKSSISDFRFLFQYIIRYFPKKKGINLLFRRGYRCQAAITCTPFGLACENFERQPVVDVVEEVLAQYSATTPINTIEALVLAATDPTVHVECLYFLIQRQPDILNSSSNSSKGIIASSALSESSKNTCVRDEDSHAGDRVRDNNSNGNISNIDVGTDDDGKRKRDDDQEKDEQEDENVSYYETRMRECNEGILDKLRDEFRIHF